MCATQMQCWQHGAVKWVLWLCADAFVGLDAVALLATASLRLAEFSVHPVTLPSTLLCAKPTAS